jgi:adenosylcobinamide-GDP ribazoletransferase
MGFVMAAVVGVLMAHISNKNFGFVNGDVLGATNEISRCAILLVTLLVEGFIMTW